MKTDGQREETKEDIKRKVLQQEEREKIKENNHGMANAQSLLKSR